MRTHTLYRPTGEIIGKLVCSDDVLEMNRQNLPPDELLYEDIDVDGSTHYYDLGNSFPLRPVITAEPNQTVLLANSPDSIKIVGLPVPCVIRVDNREYHVDNGEFEFDTPMPGIYQVTCEAFPYIPKTWEVEAV